MNLNIIYNFCRQKEYFIITSDLKKEGNLYFYIFPKEEPFESSFMTLLSVYNNLYSKRTKVLVIGCRFIYYSNKFTCRTQFYLKHLLHVFFLQNLTFNIL